MARKTFFICIILSVLLSNVLWAGGGRQRNETRTAEDPSGFTDSIDINDRKTGKHNFYMEAQDNAGNITRAGPDNIFVDPASDLPQATIINPMPSMRVQGNLNLVGIAFDDDGVGSVELTITRGGDGKGEEIVRVTADGADYWSYFLDTTNQEIWTDGIYTATAWAIDIQGLEGISDRFPVRQQKKHQVQWILDRKKPEALITSHEVGALVSGNVRISGTVADGNGINSFAYSVDGGKRYIPVKPSLNNRTGVYDWNVSLNTNIFDDGPAVLWFQSRDGCNSLGTQAHLLFVNNTGPDVGIVYPEPNATVNGVFSFAGYIKHPVGLNRVTWKAGRSSGEFDLLPGNDWYSADVDLRAEKTTSVEIEIRAEDVSGNVTVKRQRYRVDPNADLPIVTLSEPAAGGVINNDLGLVVKGVVNDDDGVKSIMYTIDNGPAIDLPATNGAFQFSVRDIAEGTHNVDVWAVDITGVAGPKVSVKGVIIPGALPESRISTVTFGSTRTVTSFYTGMTVTLEPKVRASMDITVTGNPASAFVEIGDFPAITVRPSGGKATVQFPENLSGGLTKIRLSATDRFGRESVYEEYIYITGDSYGYGNSFLFVRPNELPDGRILLKSQDEILLGIDQNGKKYYSARINGAGAESINVEVDVNGRVALSALREGNFGPFTLRLTTADQTSYDSQQFRIISDFSGPSISLTNVPSGDWRNWVQTTAQTGFIVTGANRLASVDYTLDMGVTWTPFLSRAEISAVTSPVNLPVSRAINISSAPDGALNIVIRAVNEAGRTAYIDFTALKDTAMPVGELVMPIAEARVNGTIRMGFSIAELGSLRSVTYNRGGSTVTVFDESTWNKDYPASYLEVLMDATQMPLANNMRFVFTDMAGNRAEVGTWQFIIDQQMDIPIAQVILPLENEVLTSDFIVSGVMFDDDKIKQVNYRIDGGRETTIVAENGFSIPVALSTLTDNEHTVTIIAEDIYGVRSEPVTRTFRVSLTEPAATVAYPLFDTVLRETIELRGSTFDRNGIKELKLSFDNGNTFNNVYGQGWRTDPAGAASRTSVDWNYQFNTTILKDGPHVVFIRVYDGYGIPATYATMINVDNTPPEIILDSPGDGSKTVGNLSVMGRALDPNLQSISIEMRSLDGGNLPANLRSRPQDAVAVIRDIIDISRQTDGYYNLVVIATDKAGNVTRTSRNFELARQTFKNTVEILYPLDNETAGGEFFLYGNAAGTDPAGTATLRINNIDVETTDVDDSGFFRFLLNKENLSQGSNSIVVYSNFGGGSRINSRTNNLVYNLDGPWVAIDSFNFGNFAYERPYLYGRTGYVLSEEDEALLADRSTTKELRAEVNAKKVDYTEISFDNGKTFQRASKALAKGIDYRFRLETGDMAEGMHYILVRTTMKNGDIAVTRMIVQVDKTPPIIRVITPEAGLRYNEEIKYSASATDDVELISLKYYLRIGDKASYEIPGFLQGLYLEGIIPPFIKQLANDAPAFPFGGGATYTDFGLGLSFFDDNVKIQVQYGMMTNELFEALGGNNPPGVRYGGNVFGIKLLASIYTLPLGAVWGPDFDWLFASFALGANFSLFDIGKEGYTQSGEPTWMSALLLQIEFPKVTIPKKKYLRTFSLFTEGQLWFVPTDVDAAANDIPVVIPHIIMGLRLYIF